VFTLAFFPESKEHRDVWDMFTTCLFGFDDEYFETELSKACFVINVLVVSA